MRNLKSFWFFWHPWHPWGRLSSGDIWVLRFVLKILLQWHHLADIFIFIKMISHVSGIILVPKIVILSIFIPRKLTITKIHHLIRLRFERFEHKKSQCAEKLFSLFMTRNTEYRLRIRYFFQYRGLPLTQFSLKRYTLTHFFINLHVSLGICVCWDISTLITLLSVPVLLNVLVWNYSKKLY